MPQSTIATGLDKNTRRKLITDIKTEVKPLISQMCESQIKKASATLQTQMRQIEKQMVKNFNEMKTAFHKECLQIAAAATKRTDEL